MRPITETCVDVNLSDTELNILVSKAKDWVIGNGLAMKSKENYYQDQVNIAPFLFLPTPIPRKEFLLAKEMQSLLNELIHKVAYNYDFLKETLKNTIEVDKEFTAKLFDIYQTVYDEGFSQKLSLGLIRSDYLLHIDEQNSIKQVEINTISSSFGGLVETVSKYHRYILSQLGHQDKLNKIPDNNSALGYAAGLLEAWKLYNNKKAVIMFVVEDIVYNIFDQRVIEFKINEKSPETKIIRKTLTELIHQVSLGVNKELIVDGIEVAVVYFRTGYQLEAYPSEKEWDVRLLLERSTAIKCPSIQYHLAGTKKIQQELVVPGVLEKFISDPLKIAKLKLLFTGLYSLDLDENGDKATAMAIQNPEKFVLKPQREGGGNNYYNQDVKIKLEELNRSKERSGYILMERILPPLQKNFIIRPGYELKLRDCISELGIYGVIIGDEKKVLFNNECGHILRTKPSCSDEGGIIFGAGAIDSPFLVD